MNIDRNVPLPLAREKTKYPFNDLLIGDSFLVAWPFAHPHNVRCAAQYHQRRTGKKFTTKSTDDGVRVWRVE